jgi:molecular chaperone GrpE
MKNDKKKNDEEIKKELIDEAEKEELIEEADEEIEEIDSAEQNNQDEIGEEVKRLEGQLKRAVADYQNLERRIEDNRREWILSANRSLIQKLLAVLDDLFLAQKHIQDDGLNLSIQKFLNLLKEEGVETINTKGQEFDPNTMECVSVQDGDENKVLEELRKGYIMNDRVIRPAQVIVGGKLN